ncbi:hypothetical protein [uncultured Roseobacter sp.]|uniref:hypothetical protein n=1 Tax=uncultured Roseobacter sp. TaxID=114847 RepID=UPI002601BD18|nr:hypothetical protein [uncultured Roseobacter sp.]
MKDPLKCPDDWIDPRDRWKNYDDSKVPRYIEPNGLEHWWDVKANVIRTNDENTYLSFHSYYAREYEGHSYAKLHFDGDFVTITKDGKDPDDVVFSPNFREKTEAGEQIWHVDHIFRDFVLPDNERYPWVFHWGQLPKKTIRGLDHFKDRAQQDRFIYLVTTLLSRHKGVAGKALIGEEAKGKVVFGDKLLNAFETGELIR